MSESVYKNLVSEDYTRQNINIWWNGRSRHNYRLNHFRKLYGYSGEANHWIYVHFTDKMMSNQFAYLSFEHDGILVVDVTRRKSNGKGLPHYDFTGSCKFIPADEITSVDYRNKTFGKEYTLTFSDSAIKFKIRSSHFVGSYGLPIHGNTLTESLIKEVHYYANHQYPADIYQKRIKIQTQATEKYVTQQVVHDCVSRPKGPLDSWRHFWTFRICDIDSRTGLLWDLIMTLILSGVAARVLSTSLGWTITVIGLLYYLLCLEVIRRLHDIGWSWLIVIAMLIPGVNIILLLILLFKPSIHTSTDEIKGILTTIHKQINTPNSSLNFMSKLFMNPRRRKHV